jgi:uncharacterized membrane protein YgcG
MNATHAVSLIYDKLTAWGRAVVLMLPNLIIAIFVVILFSLFARFIGRGVRKVFFKVFHKKEAIAALMAIMRIKDAFNAAGICIPFPVRTLEFDDKAAAALRKVVLPATIEDTGDPRSQWKGSGQRAAQGADIGAGEEGGGGSEGGGRKEPEGEGDRG